MSRIREPWVDCGSRRITLLCVASGRGASDSSWIINLQACSTGDGRDAGACRSTAVSGTAKPVIVFGLDRDLSRSLCRTNRVERCWTRRRRYTRATSVLGFDFSFSRCRIGRTRCVRCGGVNPPVFKLAIRLALEKGHDCDFL